MSDEQQTVATRTARTRPDIEPARAGPGEKVGRFSILSEVGAGGMGRVYEAYDPELDRKVALKLLLEADEDNHRRRLVREAQALARLDHPNVVTVHDVGVHEGVLFIAMEFVGGGTLKQWASEHPLGSQERFEAALDLLIDAARGLVAAHEAGLVHRDVKPSNILIGADGRARVADFGIARGIVPASLGESEATFGLTGVADELTQTGAFLGTPVYMAPEQLSGRGADASADQFSFCVTAWELLFGRRPFSGVDPRERLAAIQKGAITPPTAAKQEPEVLALLERGLRYRPAARHRRVSNLAEGMARRRDGQSGSRRLPTWWSGVALTVAVFGGAGAYNLARAQRRCTGAADSFESVWNDAQREKLRTAVLGSGVDFAPGAWARLESGIDAYGDAWRRAHTEACEATRGSSEQSAAQMEQRMACLEDGKRSLRALLILVSSGEASAIANDRELLAGLPNVDDCERSGAIPTPRELLILEAVAIAESQRRAGRARPSLESLQTIAAELTEATTPQVRARVQLEYGRSLSRVSSRRSADTLSEAYAIARGAGLTSLARTAARELAQQQAVSLGQLGAARRWLDVARAEAGRTSAAEDVELLTLEATLLSLEGEMDAATGVFHASLEACESEPDLQPEVLRRFAEHLGRHADERAVEVGRDAFDLYSARFGDHHPGIASFEDTLAALHADAGNERQADALARRALLRTVEVWGDGHRATAPYVVRLAELRCGGFGGREEGKRLAASALRMYSADEATTERYRTLLVAEDCVRSHRPAAARELVEKRLHLARTLYGEEHVHTSHARASLAAVLLHASELEGAETQLSLATGLTDEAARGWEPAAALQLHRVAAGVARDLGRHVIGTQHAELALQAEEDDALYARRPGDLVHSDSCAARLVLADRAGALAHCREALSVAQALSQAPRQAILERQIGERLGSLFRSDEALPYLLRAVKLANDEFGRRSYLTALAELALAAVFEDLRQHEDAKRHFAEAYEVLTATGGAHPLLIDAGTGLARAIARGGQPVESLQLLDEVSRLEGDSTELDYAKISHTRGVILNALNAKDGVRELARAIAVYRFRGESALIDRACRDASYRLDTCK